MNFTAAKFDHMEKEDEKYIISSTGDYVITWSFRNILRGRLYDYDVKILF